VSIAVAGSDPVSVAVVNVSEEWDAVWGILVYVVNDVCHDVWMYVDVGY